jgi:hypothetical protein
MRWKSVKNPNYGFDSNPLSEDMFVWVEDTIKEKGEKNKSLND